jgi:translocation and assembly module TamB
MGLTGAGLRTSAGREIVVRWALGLLERSLDGTVAVGSVEGSFTGGLAVRDFTVRDPEGELLARFPLIEVRYRLVDLLSGRIVLGQLSLDRPELYLIEDSSGVLNFERVLRLRKKGETGGPSPLIAFRDVRIARGRISIRTRDGGGESERVIENLTGTLPYVRISSPLPREGSIRFEVAELAATISDPALELKDLEGVLDFWGDSLTFALERLALPRSEGRVRGSIRWPEGPWLYDLEVSSSRFSPADLKWLVTWLPEGLSGTVDARVRSLDSEVVEVSLDRLRLAGRRRGERLEGKLGLIAGPGEHWGLEETELLFSDFSLEHLRAMFDTLPLAGRLSGTLKAAGPEERLAVELDFSFRDSLVPGWPESRLRGAGIVSLGAADDFFSFESFALRHAVLDLGTVGRLAPLGLKGTLEAAGTLDGPWRDFRFSGTLRQRDAPHPPSTVRGVLRVDTRRDTVGVWADWAADSISLTGLKSSYPWLDLDGSFAGDLKLAGYLDSLDLQAELEGPAGRLQARGALVALAPPWGAHRLEVRFERLDLNALNRELPPSYLNGKISGRALVDSLSPPAAQMLLVLDTSRLSGTPIDSARGSLEVADSVLRVDTLILWAPGLAVSAGGTLGLGSRDAGNLVLVARTDSLSTLEPLGRWLAGAEGPPSDSLPAGAAELKVALSGSLRRFSLDGELWFAGVRWGTLALDRGRVRGRWQSDEKGVVVLDLEADSLSWNGRRFSLVQAKLAGRRDSLGWFARSRIGADASAIAGGRWWREGETVSLPIDSLAVLLPSEVWFAGRGARVILGDSAIRLEGLKLASASGRARVELEGSIPRRGQGSLGVRVESLPLVDVWALLQYDPEEVGGEMSGTLELRGTASEPRITGSIALSDLMFRGFSARYLDGSLEYRNRRLTGAFGLWRSGQRILQIALELPLDLALLDVPERRLPGPLSVRVTAEGVDLSFLEAMVPYTRDTGGRLFADFGIAGTWTRPELTGRITVSDGAVTLPALGVRYEALDGRLVLSGDTIRIDTLSLRSGEGFAVIGGYVRLEELTRPILSLQLRGSNFRTMDIRDFLSFTASGDFRLEGPVLGARLTGRGTVNRGVLYFTDLITKEVINLEDPRYADLIDTSLIRQQRLGAEFQIRFLDSLRIDSLVLEMGSDVWMRSSEANVQLAGRLTVNKIRDRYRLDGTLETPRGTYRLPLTTFVTREFTVTRGQLQYFGTPDLDAALDIDARHVVRRPRENINIMVHIGGTLYSPRLSFSSDIHPPLSEAEIMSYLIFGTSSFQALAQGGQGGRNAELINTALSRLAGAISGQFEQAITNLGLPLDYFQIRPSEVGVAGLSGTEVAVGIQRSLFGIPTFLTLSPRLCPQASEIPVGLGFSAEGRLSRHFLLALSRDAVGPCTALGGADQIRYQLGLDLFWERTY